MKNYWKDENHWMCTNHMPSAKIPTRIKECWYCGSQSVRPSLKIKPPPVSLEGLLLEDERPRVIRKDYCAWKLCDKDNGNPALSRRALGTAKSKYCSLDCKNKNARYNYKQKKDKSTNANTR